MRPHLGPHVFALERERERRLDEAGLAAAIVTPPGKGDRVERLLADHPRHRVGQLDLAARALFLVLERAHDLGLQDVAAGQDLVRGRLLDRRLSTSPRTSVSAPRLSPGSITP
jgi:hypothetical protein